MTGPIAGSKPAYVSGLAALDDYAAAKKGAPFASLSPQDRDAILTDMETNAATGFSPDSAAFFALLRTHTIEGMFCDPMHGGNAGLIGWQLVGYPGPQMSYRNEIDKHFGQPWRLKPRSLEQITGKKPDPWEDEKG